MDGSIPACRVKKVFVLELYVHAKNIESSKSTGRCVLVNETNKAHIYHVAGNVIPSAAHSMIAVIVQMFTKSR